MGNTTVDYSYCDKCPERGVRCLPCNGKYLTIKIVKTGLSNNEPIAFGEVIGCTGFKEGN